MAQQVLFGQPEIFRLVDVERGFGVHFVAQGRLAVERATAHHLSAHGQDGGAVARGGWAASGAASSGRAAPCPPSTSGPGAPAAVAVISEPGLKRCGTAITLTTVAAFLSLRRDTASSMWRARRNGEVGCSRTT